MFTNIEHMKIYLALLFFLFTNIVLSGDMPNNAHKNIYGAGWSCDRGYYKSGQKCIKVKVPENAGINAYGNGWACNRGYYKSGQKCIKVKVPENAGINAYGNGWACNKNYKKFANTCIPMTKIELKKQKELEQAIFLEMQKRKIRGVTGDNCEYEYDTGAEVCVTVTDASLDCRKSYDGSYYRSCEVEVDYDVSTNYNGNDYLDTQIECGVDIKYKGRNTYSWKSDSSNDDESHSLYQYGSESGDMNIDFSFSSYKEVTNVKLDSVDCEINSVSHY